jgi:hypothetical protein
MKDLRLTIYDWVGYLFPGIIVLWIFSELFNYLEILLSDLLFYRLSDTIQYTLLFILAYFVGHLLHTLANISIDHLPSGSYPPKNYFSEKFEKDFNKSQQRALVRAISKRFEISLEEYEEKPFETIKSYYWPCYNYVVNSNSDSLAQVFISLTGLYRGLTISGFLIGLTFMVLGVGLCEWNLVIISIISLILGLFFLYRINRFKCYLTKTVYSAFLANVDQKKL